MNSVFKHVVNQYVIVYIDDILIYSPMFSQHVQHICQVLQQLREHHLFGKGGKCEFYQNQV